MKDADVDPSEMKRFATQLVDFDAELLMLLDVPPLQEEGPTP